MKFLAEGLAVFDDVFMRSEELIKLAEESTEWRPGTAGVDVNTNIRVTDVFPLRPNRSELEGELFQEALDAFTAAINVYGERYPHLRISKGENLRIMRYTPGGFYKTHIDALGNNRIVSGILYLNTDIKGGHTTFPVQQQSIQPREGRLILFPSNFMFPHESTPVEEGTKYAIVGWFS